MGYYMDQRKSKFSILKDKKMEALAALKALATQTEKMGGGSYCQGKQQERWFSWVNMEELAEAKTLEDAILAWRWEAMVGEDGNIVGIYFCDEKLGDDFIFLQALAPFVVEGSYIDMEGEDGTHWSWRFKDGQLKELAGGVVFDE
jgi:hypothetical protein